MLLDFRQINESSILGNLWIDFFRDAYVNLALYIPPKHVELLIIFSFVRIAIHILRCWICEGETYVFNSTIF